MRKSKSLLKNLSHNPAGIPGGQPAHYENNDVTSHAYEIQQRLGHMANPAIYPPQYAAPGYAPPLPVHMPAQQMSQYAQTPPAPDLGGLKANLDQLASKLSTMAQVQESRKNDRQEFDQIKQQLEAIGSAVNKLESGFSNIQSRSVEPSHVLGLKDSIDQSYRDILARLDATGSPEIDPAAYAQAVETSHESILNQVKDMQSAILANAAPAGGFVEVVETGYRDIAGKIDQLTTMLSSFESQPDGGGFSQLQGQVAALENAIDQLATRDVDVPQPDLSKVESRLEEVNRAIVALSSMERGTDNLERIEARLVDLARELESLNAQEPSQSAASESKNFDSYFAQTNAALREIDAKISAGGDQPLSALDELSNQIQQLGDKVENVAVVSTGHSDGEPRNNSALLERLDDLVQRVEQLKSPQDGESSDNSIDLLNSLQEQVEGISKQLNEFSTPTLSLDPITESLGSIEKQLGANRDIGIELAAGAAEEAIRRVVHELPTSGSIIDPETINALHQDIRKLHDTAAPTSQSEIPLDELRDMLNSIADRIGSMESHLSDIKEKGYAAPVQAAAEPVNLRHEPEPVVLTHEPEPAPAPAVSDSQVEEPAVNADPVTEVPLLQETAPQEEASPQESANLPQTEEPVETQPELEEEQSEAKIEGLSAGERLVKAARMAQMERQHAQQETEEQMAAAPADHENMESLAAHAHSLAADQAEDLLEVNPPDLAPEQMPEAPVEALGFADEAHMGQEDLPIEPGSGGPDLAALVRQANERRKTLAGREDGETGTDFLAAARKAAQAAALEASMTEAEAEEAPAKSGQSKSLLSSLPSLITKRKKALVIAAAAILLVAVAVPIVSKFGTTGNSVDFARTGDVAVYDDRDSVAPENTGQIPETALETSEYLDDGLEENPFPDELEVAEVNLAQVDIAEEQMGSLVKSVPDMSFEPGTYSFASDALKAAVEENDPIAIFEIGRRYTNGIGTDKDFQEAAKWYEHAANLGFVPAQYLIGNFNEKGVGVPVDRTMAEAWYEQAAESGHIIAMHNLAVMNASPDKDAGTLDLKKSYKWFSKAADHGVRDSQVNLGIFRAKGTGVSVDLVESYKWFAIAAKSGDADAAEKRDFVADAMRPDQLEEARKQVENWKPIEPDVAANQVSIPDSWKSADDKLAALNDQNSIAQAQTLLTRLGFDAGPADGVMGQKTRDAIVAFRSKSGLAVTDRLDSEFMDALRAVSI
ncbi:MAG: peptidoglycan-binding protein [Rhizobiaceae bacterium]